MKLILVMWGSLGDHAPVLRIAREAAHRGHQVVAIGCENYLGEVDDPRITIRSLMSREENEENGRRTECSPYWDLVPYLRRFFACEMPRLYDIISEFAPFDETVLMVPGYTLGMGARVISEQFRIPLAEYHFDPLPMFGGWFGWDKHVLTALRNGAINCFFGSGVNAFRRRVGLAPTRNLARHLMEHTDVICALYPEWLTQVRSFYDRKQRLVFAGFSLHDPRDTEPLPAEVEEFFSAGTKPILISQPSWARKTAEFVQQTEAAIAALGMRAIYTGQTSQPISSPHMLQLRSLPHHLILPRVAAFIHHGGAGTVASGLRAGVPQLIVPRLPIQHDLGVRVQRLGVGECILPRAYRAKRVARTLTALLDSPSITERCAELSRRISETGAAGAKNACDLLESLVRRREPVAVSVALVPPVLAGVS